MLRDMNNKSLQSVINVLEEALSLILEEYETLQDDELKQKYDDVIEKLQKAIKQIKRYD